MARSLKIDCDSIIEFDDKGVEKTTKKTPFEIVFIIVLRVT